MRKLFTTHPNSIGETYFQHLKFATYFGFHLVMGGAACVIHAIFPFLFKATGSNVLFKMMDFYVSRMPYGESRMTDISDKLNKKCQQSR